MALSFSEKRGLQKTVATNLAGLAAGGVAFQEKRRMQKEISDAIVKLGEKAPVVTTDTYLPEGWTESTPGGTATNTDPVTGGIVDTEIVSGEWFVIPENNAIEKLTGFKTRKEAFEAFSTALAIIQQNQNSAFTDNSMKEIVDAVVADGGQITGKNLPAEVFFLIYGGVSAKVTGITSETTGAVAGFIAKNIDTGEESSIMQTAEQAMVWLRGTFKDDVGPVENQKLTDLLSGKYNEEKPEVFIKLVKDVIDEIKEIDPVKPALLSYIEAAKAKGTISESAVQALESILES